MIFHSYVSLPEGKVGQKTGSLGTSTLTHTDPNSSGHRNPALCTMIVLYRYPTKLPMGIKTRCFHWVSPALMEDSRMLFPKKSCTGTPVNMGNFPRGEQKKNRHVVNHKSNPFAKFAKWYFLFDWG